MESESGLAKQKVPLHCTGGIPANEKRSVSDNVRQIYSQVCLYQFGFVIRLSVSEPIIIIRHRSLGYTSMTAVYKLQVHTAPRLENKHE
jgi:hypothetical protein